MHYLWKIMRCHMYVNDTILQQRLKDFNDLLSCNCLSLACIAYSLSHKKKHVQKSRGFLGRSWLSTIKSMVSKTGKTFQVLYCGFIINSWITIFVFFISTDEPWVKMFKEFLVSNPGKWKFISIHQKLLSMKINEFTVTVLLFNLLKIIC